MIDELQKQRDSWEHQHLGGFEIVYPLENPEEDYQGYLLHAKRLYEEQTGASNHIIMIHYRYQTKHKKICTHNCLKVF